jgi:hypothetical protein
VYLAEAPRDTVMMFTAKALDASWAYPYSTYQRSSTSTTGPQKLSVGVCVGIAIGCAVAVASAITAAVVLIKKRKARQLSTLTGQLSDPKI